MSRNGLFLLAAGLAVAGIACLIMGVSLQNRDIRTHVAENYAAYSRSGEATSYECDGSPTEVADRLADYQSPEARATDRGTEYLRYQDDIVIVGPDGDRPCTIRVEDVRGSRYMGGGFIFLGPGFFPGAPAGGSGGSSGGPGGSK
ncbi:DUF4247 domain-containing protein [Mycolicibacterium flavescens]|uniref:DUF4247 domain-containing protein n=1 Tax=Mycolicibacterium flavescens TaxID=1776 RepID=A0A1E3RR64_MYCFV|nr:DUF4247 domain-containing protein [Mycolicibacterium flavescens]MCV7279760.1 DUF4247 domain-containing protein [Mycolicibacterium flavescens]ODQ92396.1 hypothetical protein BHQ18_01265 [Mycolicibacterium flavescens]